MKYSELMEHVDNWGYRKLEYCMTFCIGQTDYFLEVVLECHKDESPKYSFSLLNTANGAVIEACPDIDLDEPVPLIIKSNIAGCDINTDWEDIIRMCTLYNQTYILSFEDHYQKVALKNMYIWVRNLDRIRTFKIVDGVIPDGVFKAAHNIEKFMRLEQ